MPQVKAASRKYEYDMKSLMQQSNMSKCEKCDNRREDRLLNRKLEELRIERRKVNQLRIVEKWAILNELTKFWITRQNADNENFEEDDMVAVEDETPAAFSRSKSCRPSFPPPLARAKSSPSPVHRRPRSFKTIKAESFLITTGPGVHTVTSLSGRSFLQGTPSSYATVAPDSKSMISASGPCPSPKRSKTPGITESATPENKETNDSRKSTMSQKSSNKGTVATRPVTPNVPAKPNQEASGDKTPTRPVTPGTPKYPRRPSTPFTLRRTSLTPRPLSSTSCASSVSLRGYFSGDTVEDLFPGVKIGKVNLPKASDDGFNHHPELTEMLCRRRSSKSRTK